MQSRMIESYTHTLSQISICVCQEHWYPATKLHGVASHNKTVILKDAMFYFSVYFCHYEQYDILLDYHSFLQNKVLLHCFLVSLPTCLMYKNLNFP